MKNIFLFFLVLTLTTFSKEENDFSKIKTFKATIIESSNINNRKKTKEYKVLADLPNKLIKTMISPEINKGETYLYNENKKTIYFPLLDQTIYQDVNTEENYTLKFIKDLGAYNEKSDFKVVKLEGEIKEIIYNDGVHIKLSNYSKVNGINFPKYITIFDKEIEISKLVLSNIEINLSVTDEDFLIHETTKN
ncbi:MAG: hypothetical protein KAH04_05610 [Psychrilyobacter sp.]|nr:hypothetical protein [Psychrilyobacter sp.]